MATCAMLASDSDRSSDRVRVGLAQFPAIGTKADNLDRAVTHLEALVADGAELVCLPELFTTRYFCQAVDEAHFDLAEGIDGATLGCLGAAAKKHHVTVIAPFFERRAPGLYHNSVAVLGTSGELLGVYRKMHIPDDPGFHEKFYFTPGDTGFISVCTERVEVGPLICWDQWFPEAARACALKGARVLTYPTAIGWLPEEKQELGAAQLAAWQTVQRAHAINNGVFVVAINRVGTECAGDRAIEFWGHSFICDPLGNVLAEAGTDEQRLCVDLDLNQVESARRTWPFLRDRRIDAYAGLSERWGDSH